MISSYSYCFLTSLSSTGLVVLVAIQVYVTGDVVIRFLACRTFVLHTSTVGLQYLPNVSGKRHYFQYDNGARMRKSEALGTIYCFI